MKPAPFDYVRAETLAEAHAALAAEGSDAAVIAGGQSLVPLLSMRMARPKRGGRHHARRGPVRHRGRRQCDPRRRRGAPGRIAGVAANSPRASRCWRRRCPGSGTGRRARAARSAARSRIADPSAELPLCLLALGGEVVLSSARGRRSVAAENFFTGLMSTARRDDEMIEAVSFPSARAGDRLRVRRIRAPAWRLRHRRLRGGGDEDQLRLAVGGVADRPRVICRCSTTPTRRRARRFRVGTSTRATTCTRPREYRRDARAPARPADDRGGAHAAPERRARHTVRLTLNGRTHEAEAEPRMLLTDFLRHELGLTGTHVGCEHGVCGACTVADRRRAGARLPDARGAGRRRDVRTVEGLAPTPAGSRCCRRRSAAITRCNAASARRHPDVARCAICAQRPDPDEAEIREFCQRPHLPLHRLCADRRAALDAARRLREESRACLTSARAFSRASRAIPTRWRLSTATCG